VYAVRDFICTFPLEYEELFRSNSAFSLEFPEEARLIKNEQFYEAAKLIKSRCEYLTTISDGAKFSLLNWCAIFQFLSGDLDGCMASLSKALAIYPNHASSLMKMGLVAAENNNIGEAVSLFEQCESSSTENPSFFYYRGEFLALTGNMELAIEDFSRALRLLPTFSSALSRKARCLIAVGKIDEAADIARSYQPKLHGDVEIMHCLAETMALQGRVEDCLKALNDIENIDPEYPQIYFTRALLSLKTLDPDVKEAEVNLRKALHLDPYLQEARLQLAALLSSQGRLEESEGCFDEAVEYTRTDNQKFSVLSMKFAAIAQAKVCEIYPSLKAKIRYAFTSQTTNTLSEQTGL